MANKLHKLLNSNKKGMTLVELLISIAIFSMVALIMAVGFASAARMYLNNKKLNDDMNNQVLNIEQNNSVQTPVECNQNISFYGTSDMSTTPICNVNAKINVYDSTSDVDKVDFKIFLLQGVTP